MPGVGRGRAGRVLSGYMACLALICLPQVTMAAQSPRIASLNVCTDQLLLSLADEDQIIGLSPYARNPAQSWLASQASRVPVLSGEAEDVLLLKPDIVVAGSFTKHASRDMLQRQGVRVETFDVAWTIEDARTQMLRMGALTGHPNRAQAMVARLDAAITRVRSAASGKGLRVLPLSRRGWVTGEPSLLSSLLDITGLRNAASDMGVGSGGFASLEAILVLRPDLLLVSSNSARAEDEGRALILHPALNQLYPPERRIVVPEQLTVCGGPMLSDALNRLSSELERVKAMP